MQTSEPRTFPTASPPLDEVVRMIREKPTVAPHRAPAPERVPEPVEPPEPQPTPETQQVKMAPKPSVAVEPKRPAREREPQQEGAPVSLAEYVDGVTLLDVRCPGHEQLELGVDPAGRLNVITRETHLRAAHVVEAWARTHREIIARACQGTWIDPAGRTVLHVFTDRPASLADLHGSDLRLHVLAPVDVEGRRGWYHAPLNADVV